MKHKFVTNIPEVLEKETIYISIDYNTASHSCCCGCGEEVVTPLSPTDWKIIYDGNAVSLDPSIGNWNFDCKSHYWIRNSNIMWAKKWSEEEIIKGRQQDIFNKREYYGTSKDLLGGKNYRKNISKSSPRTNSLFSKIKLKLMKLFSKK